MIHLRKFWKVARWPLLALIIVWVGLVLAEVKWPVSKERSDAAVAAIHAQRLTMADVDGTNLPPEPDAKKNNATVAGIDANQNGIRDDVELAIFKKYPTNKKVRSAGLQYALALQTRLAMTINETTWAASVYMKSRAYKCIANSTGQSDGVARLKATTEVTNFVNTLMINTEKRNEYDKRLERFASSDEPTKQEEACDVH